MATQADNVTVWAQTMSSVNASGAVPRNCLSFSSSDETDDLISPDTERLVFKIKSGIVIPLFYLLGGPTNLLNAIVFFKQGLQERVTLCLFSAAFVDFVFISFIFVIYSEQMLMFTSPETYGTVYTFLVNHKIMIFYNTVYASVFLRVLLSLEMCLGVLFPLRSKLLLKTKTMAVIIVIGISVITSLRLVVMAKYVIMCFYDKRTHLTFMGLYATDYEARNKELLDFIDGVLYGTVMSFGGPVIVLITTIVTIVKLWQIAAWRRQTSSANTSKEIGLTKMLLISSLSFLICALPGLLLRVIPLFIAEFSSKGRYRLFFLACISIVEMCPYAGMASSFVLYYWSSSRYKETLGSLSKRRSRFNNSMYTKSEKSSASVIPNSISIATVAVY